ncbi:hypothetical protein [Prosthecobacter sp.]|uniref:SLOG domain-containing protein n=1 Tax=Prosthecobacter sp. TaxID=1965333 RepID=UPI0037842330
MPAPQTTPQSRLHRSAIFLSAKVPTQQQRQGEPKFEVIHDAFARIEEAVISLARAIFMEGGTLVFGAHPSISPLVARVIQDFYLPEPAPSSKGSPERPQHWKNPALIIYQSKVWQKDWAQATQRLERHPLVTVKWTDIKGGEKVDPKIEDRSQAPRSLTHMREAMIKDTDFDGIHEKPKPYKMVAMVAIGGMGGVLEEADIFAREHPGLPIYTYTTTGGAAAMLSSRQGLEERTKSPDAHALADIQKFWTAQAEREEQARRERSARRQEGRSQSPLQQPQAIPAQHIYIPYGYVAQQIVADLVNPQHP